MKLSLAVARPLGGSRSATARGNRAWADKPADGVADPNPNASAMVTPGLSTSSLPQRHEAGNRTTENVVVATVGAEQWFQAPARSRSG